MCRAYRDANNDRNPNCNANSDRDGNAEIYVLDLETSALRNVSQHPSSDTDPAWSPDGDWLVFRSWRSGRPWAPW